MIDRRLVIGALLAALPLGARAQVSGGDRFTWPLQALSITVPTTADAVPALFLRGLAPELARLLAVRVAILPDADATKATSRIAKAAADGYRLLAGTQETMAIAPALHNALPYDPVGGFEPVIGLCDVPLVLASNRRLPGQTLRDLIDLTRADPTRYGYGSSGIGSTGHLAAELFRQRTGAGGVHRPLSGEAATAAALAAGTIDYAVLPLSPLWTAYRNGQLRILAQMGTNRYKALTGIPTLREAGVSGAEVTGWFACYAPAGIAPAVADQIAAVLTSALGTAAGKALLDQLGLVAAPRGVNDMQALMSADRKRFTEVARLAGLRGA